MGKLFLFLPFFFPERALKCRRLLFGQLLRGCLFGKGELSRLDFGLSQISDFNVLRDNLLVILNEVKNPVFVGSPLDSSVAVAPSY